MYKKKSLDKIKASMGCVRETPDIKISQHGTCKTNSPDQIHVSMGCVRETPHIKKKQHGMFKRDSLDKTENSTDV